MMIKKGLWLVVIAGHILERYEVTLYGFYAAILAPIFFPNENSRLSVFFSLATFAAGYVMRPLGGVIFGHIGDTMGRKKALLSSILCVTFPTFIIGILPTYAQIGAVAPIILILCRLLQGLCVGGEYSGAAVFFFEQIKPNLRGFGGSIMSATAFLGAVLGTLVGACATFFCTSSLAWRLPFLLGSILGIMIYFLRRNMFETPMFEKIQKTKEVLTYPLIDLLKTNKTSVICSFLVGAQGHMILYITTIYMNAILIKILNLEKFQTMVLNAGILILWITLMPCFGKLSDKIGKLYLMFFLSLGIFLFTFPLFLLINNNMNLFNVVLIEIVLSFFGAGLFGVTSGFLPQLFKTHNRYSGVALGQTLGQACLGGTSPLIATWLSTYIGDINAPAVLVTLSGLFGLIGSVLALTQLKYNLKIVNI